MMLYVTTSPIQVVVIDKGQIAEMGTHSELLARHGVYKRLVLRQLTAGNQGLVSHAPSTTSPTETGHGSLEKGEATKINEKSKNGRSSETPRLVDVEDSDNSDNDGEYDFYGADSEEVKLLN